MSKQNEDEDAGGGLLGVKARLRVARKEGPKERERGEWEREVLVGVVILWCKLLLD